RPRMELSEDEQWGLMIGHTITRSWMVWSNGHCPACGEDVPMYNWEIDAIARPWKVRCPHCGELFPKNDFQAFYQSGLDGHGVFDPERADRSLLFNAECPDPQDPRHLFGVDDGEGYVEGDKRWRFIGAYLIYGQWKQAVLGGIRSLADAWSVTGDPRYARRAGILLDRVADLYPSFDYKTQGLVYEQPSATGYVSVWHDACEETRQLALAWDQVRPAVAQDTELAVFLARKAAQYDLPAAKTTPTDVVRHIEDGILRDPLANRGKISSNYPRTDIATAVIMAALDWPNNRDQVMGVIDGFLNRATAVDGVTGEKGLANYSAFGIQSVALFLARWERAMPGFLEEVLQRHPELHDTFRFHIDTWCLNRYYPLSGDSGWFAAPIEQYQGVRFRRPGHDADYSHREVGLDPTMFEFMWHLYELTGDPAFVQVLYLANDANTEGLPWDLLARDPEGVQRGVQAAIDRHGRTPRVGSVNKREWHIALLRSGRGEHARVAWLDYDSGGGHGHLDGMNLGLFALDLDLLPDFGYPPVQFGGWGSPRSVWYRMTAAHNTVVVDGANQADAAGATTLWAIGQNVRAMRASASAMYGTQQYERTAALVDVDDESCYLLDIFRVVGGSDHAKFLHSHYGRIATTGLALAPAEDYGHGTQMRDFQVDPAAEPGWSATWDIEDRYGLLAPDAQVHLRYTDLTSGAQAGIAEAWVVAGIYSSTQTAWIPRLMVRRRTDEPPLASTFVGVIEPYAAAPAIGSARRLGLHTASGAAWPDSAVAVEVRLRDGRRDLFVSADSENPLGLTPSLAAGERLVHDGWGLALEGEWCFVRANVRGAVERIATSHASSLEVGGVRVELSDPDLVELTFRDGRAALVRGREAAIRRLVVAGRETGVSRAGW
ncbi:MAG: heparinase II/III family protein, partial [Armatimonadota bacterium]